MMWLVMKGLRRYQEAGGEGARNAGGLALTANGDACI